MPTTSKAKSRKKKPTPEQRADKAEISEDARLTLEIGGETYVVELKLWKELKSDGKATS